MLCRNTLLILTAISLLLGSTQSFARSIYQEKASSHIWFSLANLEQAITESDLYEELLSNTDFLKIQDMFIRMWNKQTYSSRRYARQKSPNYSPMEAAHPMRRKFPSLH